MKISLKPFAVLALASQFVFLPASASAQTAVCLNFSVDLAPGASDAYPTSYLATGEVLAVQNYLFGINDLTAVPNGHYGPATTAAVQKFQSMNGISPTGTVGPITRAAIQRLTCGATVPVTTVNTTSAANSATYVTASPNTSNTSTSNPQSVVSPSSGTALTIGTTYPVLWNSVPFYPYNLVLEQSGGATAGFLATNLSGTSTYAWTVGNVFNSSIGANQVAATGTYRVRIEGTTGGPTNSDPVSGWFTLLPAPLIINFMQPNSVPSDNKTSVVMYGSGFNSSSIIYFDQQYGTTANIQYVSPDGTVIVFTVPTTIYTGSHSVFVGNGSAQSNMLTLVVTTPH